MRYELTDYEYATIKPMLPNKPRGVPRVPQRHLLGLAIWRAMARSTRQLRPRYDLLQSLRSLTACRCLGQGS
jgi:hypothetical protein